ncbi:MAG: PIN domain-containing protein [Candidatus Methanomethyliaceae archaeon]|nr:PIN domain-containing protein [Candidatus Methanomethyliaceae archaeon]
MAKLDHLRRKIAVKVVIDAYAWVELFIGSKSGKKAMELIQNSDEAFTPDIVLAEVARKYLREGMDEETIQRRLTVIEEVSEITPIDKEIALESAKCYMLLSERAKKDNLRGPSLFDAVVLATARTLRAKIITGDEYFKNLDEVLWIAK